MSASLVVVPVYLTQPSDLEVTLKMLESLRATEPEVECLLVDDASPAAELLAELEAATSRLEFELHRKSENEGFSRAVNVGLRRALNAGQNAVLVNADIEFIDKNWLKVMEARTSEDGTRLASIVGGLLIYPTGLIQHAGIFFSLLHRCFDHWYKYAPADLPEALRPRRCPVTGALQFIRHECLSDVGLYDEEFRMGWEDVDYCVDPLTPVLTAEGWRSAGSLAGREVDVATMDGEFRPARWFTARGGEQRLHTVKFEDGQLLRATAEHRWPVRKEGRGGWEWCTTTELAGRRVLIAAPRLRLEMGDRFRRGVQHGFTFGDGTANKGRPSAKVVAYPANPAKQEFVKAWFDRWSTHRNGNVVGLDVPAEFKSWPESDDREYLAGFIAGWIAADGCVSDGGPRLQSANVEALCRVDDVLDEMGLRAGALTVATPRQTAYGKIAVGTLGIPSQVVRANPWLTLRPDHRCDGGEALRSLEVVSVDAGRMAAVVCCEEPVTRSWVTAGGIVTGNCIRAWQSGRDVIYEPRVRAFHYESMFRGRPNAKVADWQQRSWMYFMSKHRATSFAEFVPALTWGVQS